MKTNYQQELERNNSKLIKVLMSDNVDKFDFKEIIIGLRTVLEYLSSDINKSLITQYKRPQFPVFKDEKNFLTDKYTMLIKAERPDILAMLESTQPYNLTNDWMRDFVDMSNYFKHNDLPQSVDHKTTIYKDLIRSEGPGQGTMIRIEGVRIGDSDPLFLTIKDGEVIYDNPGGSKLDFEIINKTSILFNGKIHDAKKFISLSVNNIAKIVEEYDKIKNSHKK